MSGLRSRKQQREQLVRSLRASGASWVEVSAALQQRYRLNARVALRYAHGWSQRQAADEWNRRWPDEPKTSKVFSLWEMWPGSTGFGRHSPTSVSWQSCTSARSVICSRNTPPSWHRKTNRLRPGGTSMARPSTGVLKASAR
jgi:hypothetical protein